MKVLSELKKIHITYVILSLFAGSAFCEGDAPATAAEPPATAAEPSATVAEPSATAAEPSVAAAEPSVAAAEPSVAAIGDAALAERTKPFGRVYVADEPYLLLAEENKGLKDKLAEAEMQMEDIKGQIEDFKNQLTKKDEEITALKQKATMVAAVDQAPAAGAAAAGGEKKAAAAGDCKTHFVMATATTFEPKVLFINPCDTVTFQNMLTHDAQAFDDLIPEGAKAFWVPINQNGSVTLDVEGVYIYKCNPHYPLGMAGSIIVGNAHNFEQVQAKVTGRAKGIVIKVKRALAKMKG
jgi:pseudoazurin